MNVCSSKLLHHNFLVRYITRWLCTAPLERQARPSGKTPNRWNVDFPPRHPRNPNPLTFKQQGLRGLRGGLGLKRDLRRPVADASPRGAARRRHRPLTKRDGSPNNWRMDNGLVPETHGPVG